MSIDLKKPLSTRDGRKVTIYRSDCPGDYPIHGAIDGCAIPFAWSEDGSISSSIRPSSHDLVNGEPEKYFWVNIHDVCGDVWQSCVTWKTKEEADRVASDTRVGRLKIKIEARMDE
jgi:hypothetical protein